jgi:hypothetical protein
MAAAKPFKTLSVLDLWWVRGGVDKETRALQLVLSQATSAIEDVAKSLAPQNAGMMQMVLQMMSKRPSGRGPTPAPALPPTTTLTR